MTIPQRRKRERSGIRDNDGPIRCPGHLQFVRGHECVCKDRIDIHGYALNCSGKIEAAHVRIGTDGGIGQKPGDDHTVSLCQAHHAAQHGVGEKSFWARVGLDPHKIAADLWNASKHRLKWELKSKTPDAGMQEI